MCSGRPRPWIIDEIERWDDVERRAARDLVGMVAQQPVGHPRAAVVTGDREAVKAERRHHFDLVQCQRAFRIVDKILAGQRLRAVTVATQIRHNNGEIPRQARRHLAPHHMRLRKAVH